jgi:hypothetical protein
MKCRSTNPNLQAQVGLASAILSDHFFILQGTAPSYEYLGKHDFAFFCSGREMMNGGEDYRDILLPSSPNLTSLAVHDQGTRAYQAFCINLCQMAKISCTIVLA